MADTLQQTWEQQYQALEAGKDTYKNVVTSLMEIKSPKLSPAQQTILESSQRGQLDTEYQIRQFLNTDQRLLADAARLTHRLQNDSALQNQPFLHDQLTRKRDQLISEAGDFAQLRTANKWHNPETIDYEIGGKRYDNTGAPPVWNWMSIEGRLGQSVDSLLSTLQSVGQAVGDVLRPFTGGATSQEAGIACAGLVNWVAGQAYGKLFNAPAVPGATPNAQFFSNALFADTQGKAIELSFNPGENACRLALPKDAFKRLIHDSGVPGWSALELDRLPESMTIELPVEPVRAALAQEATVLWLSEGVGRDPAQQPVLLAALDSQYQTFGTMSDVSETFWDVALKVTPSTGPTTDLFTLTTTPDHGASETEASDPTQSVSRDNRTLIDTGTCSVKGLGNVNEATGNTAYANNLLTGGFRPGAQELAQDILASQLARNFLDNPALVNSPVWTPETRAVATNLLASGVQQCLPTDPLVLDLDGDGVKLTAFGEAPVLFDIDHDGTQELSGWVSAEDGLVVMDLNGNGRIDDIGETLSEYFTGAAGGEGNPGEKKYADGFAALKSLDSNADHAFTATDTAWANVKVWTDANHDAQTDAGELKTLDDLGITAIDLTPTAQSGLVNGGNEVLATGRFTRNGQTQVAQAARFLANPTGHTTTVNASGATVTAADGQSTYISSLSTGEAIDVSAKGVKNATGHSGNDTLTGSAEANWLIGNQGADRFDAGAGDDVLLIDAEDRQHDIHAGDGFDMVQGVGRAGVTLNLAQAEAEIAIGGSGNDILIGENGADLLTHIERLRWRLAA